MWNLSNSESRSKLRRAGCLQPAVQPFEREQPEPELRVRGCEHKLTWVTLGNMMSACERRLGNQGRGQLGSG